MPEPSAAEFRIKIAPRNSEQIVFSRHTTRNYWLDGKILKSFYNFIYYSKWLPSSHWVPVNLSEDCILFKGKRKTSHLKTWFLESNLLASECILSVHWKKVPLHPFSIIWFTAFQPLLTFTCWSRENSLFNKPSVLNLKSASLHK